MHRLLEEVLDTTLSLLAVHYTSAGGGHVTPVHFLALVDSRAIWFSKWMVRAKFLGHATVAAALWNRVFAVVVVVEDPGVAV